MESPKIKGQKPAAGSGHFDLRENCAGDINKAALFVTAFGMR
jgi:hypothetical protein